MNRLLFAWDRYGSQLRQENHWREVFTLLGLFLAAMILCLLNLNQPNLSESEELGLNWLNSLSENQFTIIKSIVSFIQKYVPSHSGWFRLPSAVLTALSIPLLYSLAKENFRLRLPALLSAFIYLTALPILFHGRMAHLHGLILFLEMTLFWCGLRSRRDLRWALGVGFSGTTLILVDQWTGLLLMIGLLGFFCWDTPRLITSGYFWLGSILGSLLPLGLYVGFGLSNGDELEQIVLFSVFSNINGVTPQFFLTSWLKLLIFSLPWLIFVKDGFQLAWRERHWSWAKLVIVWGCVVMLGIGLNPFSSSFQEWLSVYPVFALTGGMILGQILYSSSDRSYSSSWSFALFTLAILAFMGGLGLYFNLFSFFPNLLVFAAKKYLILLSIALILTFTVAGVLILRRNKQFIAILVWGMYVSLMVWFSSPHWMMLI